MQPTMLLLCTLCTCITYSHAQSVSPDIEWQKCLGGFRDDAAWSVEQTSDEGYIMAGYSYSTDGDVSGHHGIETRADYWVVKTDSIGNIQWQKSLGGGTYDYAYGIQQTADEGYIVAGASISYDGDVSGNHGGYDYWIVKLDGSGNIQWQKSLGGTKEDYAYNIHQTTDGGYIVAGLSASNNGDVTGNHGLFDYWIVKLDGTGNIQWQKSLGGSYYDNAYDIRQTTDGGYVVIGESESDDGDVTGNHGLLDYWIVKLDGSGNIQWQKCLGGGWDDRPYSIRQTTEGGYIIAGWSLSLSDDGDVSGNHGANDYWIVKLDDTGNIQWQKSLGGSSNDYAYDIQQTTDSGYIVGGYSNSNDNDVSGNHGGYDYWIVKLGDTGNIQWQKSLGGTKDDNAYSICQTVDEGYVVVGASLSNNGDVSGNHSTFYYDYWMVKLYSDGCTATKPTITSSDSTTNVCPGNTVTLTSTSATSYLWSTGATTQSIIVSAAGNYSVTITDINGCQNTSDVTVVTYQGCSAPAGLAVSNITATSAKIKWNASACGVGYQFQYRKKGTSVWKTVKQTGTSKTITGLTPSTTYQWQVLTGCKITAPVIISSYTTGPEFTTTASLAGAVITNEDAVSTETPDTKVYPNPAHTILNISMAGNTSKAFIKIYDAQSRELMAKEFTGNTTQLTVSQLTPGMYFIRIIDTSGKLLYNGKFVKQ